MMQTFQGVGGALIVLAQRGKSFRRGFGVFRFIAAGFSLAPRLRALRVASPSPYRGQHLRPGKAGSSVFREGAGPLRGAAAAVSP
jgi:hypothetical protein